jgi:hypothetical protein
MKIVILLLLGTVTAARADSVDLSDKTTVFGRIMRMDETELVLTGDFKLPSGVVTQEVKIPRNQVVKIEFDDTTFNPGGPPGIGARPPGPVSSPQGQDEVEMGDGRRQPCAGATIDNHQILHCGKQTFPESDVIRIRLARK